MESSFEQRTFSLRHKVRRSGGYLSRSVFAAFGDRLIFFKTVHSLRQRVFMRFKSRNRAAAGHPDVQPAFRPRPTSRKDAGFTLVEMLVVITIIGLIVGLIGPRVLNYLSDSKTKTARIQIANFAAALDLYYLDNGHYPTSSVGLTALVQRPADIAQWNGPYLKGTTVPNDPWGNTYAYVFPGQHGNPYDIISYGSDGREGGTESAADIASWQK